LLDNGFAAGTLDQSAQPGIVRWRSAAFVTPFEFPISAVSAIHWPAPAATPKPSGDYRFELSGGDVVFGSLVALDAKTAEIEIPHTGRVTVERNRINRIYRWRDSADLIYVGPNGLTGWTETIPQRLGGVVNEDRAPVRIVNGMVQRPAMPRNLPPPPEPPPSHWREESGQILTDVEGASIGGDFDLPARSSIEVEISWKTKPDFVLALGVNDGDRLISSKRAFRFEAWGGDLVVQRELEHEADLAVVQELGPGPGRAHLNIYLDQEKGRIIVFSPAGAKLAELRVANPIPAVLPGIYLANTRGDIRLEWLRIGRWNGELPREVKLDQARIHLADGSIAYGNVSKFDPVARQFVVKSESGETRIDQAKAASVFLSAPAEEPARPVRVVEQDGMRVSGSLEKVDAHSIWLNVPGFSQPLALAIEALRSLVVSAPKPAKPEPPVDHSSGRLELDGLRLPGRLVDGKADANASCLVWRPTGALAGSALTQGISGRIVYKEAASTVHLSSGVTPGVFPGGAAVQPPVRVAPAAPGGVGGMVVRFAEAIAEKPATPPSEDAREPRSLYLRDGDVIPCTITGIEEKGVRFKTSASSATFVAHDKIKAIELSPERSTTPTVRLTKSKLERLLTLPRMQKPSPPTQLIRSTNGDYLRGRVLKMDDKTLEVEVHLETKTIPRDRISRIIWLHADEVDPKARPAPSVAAAKTRVQAVRNDGIRLTFQAERFADACLCGTSDVLGPCQVAVKDMDQLLIGAAIDEAAAQLAFQPWKLKNAPDPKYVSADDDEAGAGGEGIESPLVGKPAPDFTLDLLDGTKFHLADSKGKIIVLDFWATWCGPCIQAMPQVERAVEKFKEKGVRLIAVNLQETPDQIKAMLDRQKLKVNVALDKTGAIAEKYQATAIPQTVIIEPGGKVARLYVGGGARFQEQLEEALTAVLGGEKK
jgi:peroxiredoxin